MRTHPFLLGLMVFTCGGLVLAARFTSAEDAVPRAPELRWWKGNLHTHSLWSDGNDFPEMIASWYRDRDYHFLAITDHNTLSQGIRWMRADDILNRGGIEILEKYQARFGGDWIETRGEPGTAAHEFRLKPFDEYRALVEASDRFILIQSEEISDRAEGKPVHINAANTDQKLEPQGGETVREAIANNFRMILEHEKSRGREMLPHLNHPNFGWAVTAEDLAHVVADQFYEVYNGHPGVNHLGDKEHPSVERIWDLANAIRLTQLNAQPLLGIATDDTHHYHGKGGSRPGRGWVMVRAHYLSPEQLIRAMKRGDFYASSGVTLADVQYDSSAKKLSLKVQPQLDAKYTTQFIATLRTPTVGDTNEAVPQLPAAEAIGTVVATVEGVEASYTLRGDELYVRAVVTCSLDPVDPSFAGQKQQAWTQPVGWQ